MNTFTTESWASRRLAAIWSFYAQFCPHTVFSSLYIYILYCRLYCATFNRLPRRTQRLQLLNFRRRPSHSRGQFSTCMAKIMCTNQLSPAAAAGAWNSSRSLSVLQVVSYRHATRYEVCHCRVARVLCCCMLLHAFSYEVCCCVMLCTGSTFIFCLLASSLGLQGHKMQTSYQNVTRCDKMFTTSDHEVI